MQKLVPQTSVASCDKKSTERLKKNMGAVSAHSDDAIVLWLNILSFLNGVVYY